MQQTVLHRKDEQHCKNENYGTFLFRETWWTGLHESENSTNDLNFPVNFNTLDILTPQEMIHTTHEIDATSNQWKHSCKEIFGHDTAVFVSIFQIILYIIEGR